MTDSKDRDWLIPVAALAAVEFLAAQALAFAIHYPGRPDAVGQFLFGAVFGLFMLAGFYTWQFAKLAQRMTANPTRRLIELTRERTARILAIAAGLVCISLHWIAFNWMKSMLPVAVPFWADPALAEFDQFVFGRAAWEWALEVAGPTSIIFKTAYGLWLPLLMFVLAGVLCFQPSLRKARLLTAFLLMWIIGAAASYAVSSAGPFFYEALGFGTRFHDLSSQAHIGNTPRTVAYLWSNYEKHSAVIGGGISAFPSMHVASAFWIALVFRHWSGWIFAALVFYGSFLLGWHYFLDAPAGIAVTLIAYFLAGRVTQLLASDGLPNLRKALPNSGVQVENLP